MNVHALRIEAFLRRKFEQCFDDVAASLGCTRRTRDAKPIATTGDLDIQSSLDLSQVFVKLTAKIGQAVIIGGLENDVS